MNYVSTRGRAPAVDFEGVVLAGMASDGGLYVPDAWPRLAAADLAALAGRPYSEIARRVLLPFAGEALDEATLGDIVDAAYADFDHAAVAPLRQLAAGEWLLELFHGPTLAFKDYALQILGRLMDHFLTRRGSQLTIVGATSGDTGSAAIAACRDRAAIRIVILHPHGRVSEVQRRQMTTVDAPNVYNVAIEGTFDDCQAMVKALFADAPLREELSLGAVNSINWARIAAQVVYYVAAGVALGAPRRTVVFSVPTGNFGDVYAGYVAKRLGLPIECLIVATNRNDILARFFDSGAYRPASVFPTLSPSMDIQVASNFERLLADVYDRDGDAVSALMADLAAGGGFEVPASRLGPVRGLFAATRVDEDETIATIRAVAEQGGGVVDPHTAVGIAAGRRLERCSATPLVCLATAHPAKFPDAVARALGSAPPPPPAVAALANRAERCQLLPNDIQAVKDYVRALPR